MKKVVLILFLASLLFVGVDSVEARPATDINGNPFCEEGEYCPSIDEVDPNEEETIIPSNTYQKVQCGDIVIPKMAATLVHTIYVILQIAVPVLIIIFGSLDLLKATIAQKEDEIKKGQHIFVRRLILGAVVFVVFALVQLAVGLVAPRNTNVGMWDCVDCLINADC